MYQPIKNFKNQFKEQDDTFSDIVINKKRIYEEIADQIEKRIIAGQIKPGDKLPPERSLAKQFDVSVLTIQKSLVALSTAGYIKIVHGDGAYVTNYSTRLLPILPISRGLLSSETMLFQLTEIRKIFECQIIRLSAIRRTDKDLDLLKDILMKEEQAVKDLDINICGQLDVLFHVALARASQNVIAENFINSLFDPLLELITMTRKIPEYLKDSIYFHRKLYEFVLAKEPEEAQKYMKKHLDLQEKALLELYELNMKETKER